MKIAIGTNNPVKIEATKEAFQLIWPPEKLILENREVESTVASQPMSDEESIKGAVVRAQQAIQLFDADYGVGLEGGIQIINDIWFNCGVVAIVNRQGLQGFGSSARIQVPTKAVSLIRQGKELGEVDDILFGIKNSKRANGLYGLMTNNVITRKDAYKQGIISALSRFIHPEVYI